MKPPAPPRLPRGPFVLLGLMTATTIFGPILIGLVLRGGAGPIWPPDRPVEWMTLVMVCTAVVGLMGACLALARTNRSGLAAMNPDRATSERPIHSVEVDR